MAEAVIVDSVRTPIGRAFKGSMKDLRPDETAAFVIDALLERNPAVDPMTVEDVYMGCGLPQGLQANNIGRIAVLLSQHLTEQTNGVTISRYCASSLESIRLAANASRRARATSTSPRAWSSSRASPPRRSPRTPRTRTRACRASRTASPTPTSRWA